MCIKPYKNLITPWLISLITVSARVRGADDKSQSPLNSSHVSPPFVLPHFVVIKWMPCLLSLSRSLSEVIYWGFCGSMPVTQGGRWKWHCSCINQCFNCLSQTKVRIPWHGDRWLLQTPPSIVIALNIYHNYFWFRFMVFHHGGSFKNLLIKSFWKG